MFGALASGDYFRVLGAAPALGRMMLPEDATPHAGQPVMVLSYDAWQSRFGGDSGIVGRKVMVHSIPLTVVGVAARGFSGTGPIPPDFWAPITLLSRLENAPDLFGPSEPQVLRAVVRLRPGVTDAAATAALATWAEQATADLPDSARWSRVQLVPAAKALPLSDETIATFAPAAVAFALVLLLACANVANVMLARGLARQREIGVRLSLGAERGRLVRQLLTESALLALPAAGLGFLLSRWTVQGGVRIFLATLPRDIAPYLRFIPLTPDLRVFAFILATSLGAALLFGLAPALQATRADVVQASRGDFDAGLRSGRMRSALVVSQITVCSLLLIVTGVLLRGAQAASNVEMGIRTADVVQLSLDDSLRAQALPKLRAERIVRAVGATTQLPLDGIYPALGVRPPAGHDITIAGYDFVDAGYFDVLGIPLLRGRAFSNDEAREGAPVAVVSEAAAHALWPNGDAIGQLVQLSADVPKGSRLARVRSARVVGVAANAVSGWIGIGLDRPVVYYPVSADSAGAKLLVRVAGGAEQGRESLDRDLESQVPGSVYEIHALPASLAVQRWPFRAFSWISSAIGAVALLLTLIGIYGVLSYLVQQRTKEIGIRMALGASVPDVVGGVLRQSLQYGGLGIAAGGVLALGVSHFAASVIRLVNVFDPLGYAFGAAVVLAACLAAAWAPSRRAARVNPVEALRQQ